MDLATSLKGMFDAQDQLRQPTTVMNPSVMSKQMYRLSQYTGSVETILSEYERDYELHLSQKMQKFITQGIKTTPAETKAKMELGEEKSKIVYLGRIVASSWRQVGVIQSRINHLIKESTTQI